ncbi:MAG: Ldh family oxidoreductase [Candidatus Latescibacteria bacterium]|nr:Ldh family oxidoreductase [Candidatus Latescibacterota bacterium]
MGAPHRFQAAYLHATARRLFTAAGAPRHIADDVAEVLVNSNLTGHDSHGVLRVPAYLNGISNGGIVPAAEPKVVQETAVTLLLDGNGGFGHYTARKAMALAIEKAKQAHVCCVSFTQIGHMGRLGEYAEAAARAGCIGLLTYGIGARDSGSTVPYGGAKGTLGTNPIAVGIPTGDDTPFIIDFATSTVAEGKLQVARSKGADLPQGLIVDKHGAPSVKPADFYDGGYLLPFGGHKGYALSLMVCLLGGLAGGFNAEKSAMGGMFMQGGGRQRLHAPGDLPAERARLSGRAQGHAPGPRLCRGPGPGGFRAPRPHGTPGPRHRTPRPDLRTDSGVRGQVERLSG